MLKHALSLEERKTLIKNLSKDKEFKELLLYYMQISKDIGHKRDEEERVNYSAVMEHQNGEQRNILMLLQQSLSLLEHHQMYVKNMILKKCDAKIDLFEDFSQQEPQGDILFENIMILLTEHSNIQKRYIEESIAELLIYSLVNLDLI
ncbi:hypothetical protein [Jeotgalibacillus campisalis]|uniref:Uncharacterized protein n=1 Tax=Jeotgalibacillus campisalis TaxID=220754 RepID=A0A0C2VGZ5_9BACL|nr:hypothetical protein [Jeotgalibacillus campisalis]KIL43786.1 hypothetical protein KR50_33060 [Jeotgalibacillus campisalis]